MELTLSELDRSLSSLTIDPSIEHQSFQDNGFPAPSPLSRLNHTVNARASTSMQGSPMIADDNLGDHSDDTDVAQSLRPRRQLRRHPTYKSSDSETSVSDSMSGDARTVSTAPSSVCSTPAKTMSAAAAHAALPRLSARANNKITEHVLQPLLSKAALKDFHPIVKDVPRRIHNKEIISLRDLEKTLMFMAPVSPSQPQKGYARSIAHWFSYCLQTRSKTIGLYLEFCTTSISCIQATVEFISEREQTRPNERPYTNGYFVDLVDQIKNYAQQLSATKESPIKNEDTGEMEYQAYVLPPLPAFRFGSPKHASSFEFEFGLDMTHTSTICSGHISNIQADIPSHSTDEIKLIGGLAVNGQPSQLVRVKANGDAISLATGLPILLESIEAGEQGMRMKRSLSMQEEDDESLLRCMARRKGSASSQPRPAKTCRQPGCGREFIRSCDLAKHEKTHSRPWKCSFEECKYHTFGWPTEKELERHINDKHCIAPKMYECMFPPCIYKSKRESNCKQHMEKLHGYEYVRSKSNGKKAAPSVAGSDKVKVVTSLPTPVTINHRTPSSDGNGASDEDIEINFNDYQPKDPLYTFNNGVFADQSDYPIPVYPRGTLNEATPYLSPGMTIDDGTSANTSPSMDASNDMFDDAMSALQRNNGDFSLYGDDDIYSVNRAFIPSTLDHYGQGNPMLCTPPMDNDLGFLPSSKGLDLFAGFPSAGYACTNNDTFSHTANVFDDFCDVPMQVEEEFIPLSNTITFPSSQDFLASFYQPVDIEDDSDMTEFFDQD